MTDEATIWAGVPERYVAPEWFEGAEDWNDLPEPDDADDGLPEPDDADDGLPEPDDADDDLPDLPPTRRTRHRWSSRPIGVRDLTLLIVEDERTLRDALCKFFEDDGFRVVGDTADAARAVRAAERLQPDVVLMDLRMPGMSGVEATAEIKRRAPDTAVVVLTAYDDPALKDDALEAGAYCFISKGSSVALLLAAVRAAGAAGGSATHGR